MDGVYKKPLMPKEKILITGAAGFIGLIFVSFLLRGVMIL
jgi:nucleoside-diphosphate-sugar epimerase